MFLFIDAFILQANESYNELNILYNNIDRSLFLTKKILGENIIIGNNNTANANDDACQSFFTMIIQFTEMYKMSIQELIDWKEQERKLQLRLQSKKFQKAIDSSTVLRNISVGDDDVTDENPSSTNEENILFKMKLKPRIQNSNANDNNFSTKSSSNKFLDSLKEQMLSLKKTTTVVKSTSLEGSNDSHGNNSTSNKQTYNLESDDDNDDEV
jgi:hypothetical protein